MRARPALALFGALLAPGCTLTLHRDHDQCRSSTDCAHLAPSAVCTQSGVCELLQVEVSATDASCQLDSDCRDGWSICREGTCRALAQHAGCVPVSSDANGDPRERLPVGLLLPATERGGVSHGDTLGAMQTAIDELNRHQWQNTQLPRIVAVACDEDDSDALTALAKQRVRLFIGPTGAGEIEKARQVLGEQAVLFAPFADAPSLNQGPAAAGLASLVSCKPNYTDNRASLLSAISYVQSQLLAKHLIDDDTTALAVSDRERALGFGDFGPAELAPSGTVRVDYMPEVQGRDLTSALDKQSLVPSLLASASSESIWAENIATLDRGATAGHYPYYLLNGQDASVLAFAINDVLLTPREYDRVLSLRDQQSTLSRSPSAHFKAAFRAEFDRDPAPGLDFAYDCTFLAVYAALAAELRFSILPSALTPAAALVGLRALSGGTATFAITEIDKVELNLELTHGADSTLSLFGSSGDLALLGSLAAEQIILHSAGIYVRPAARNKELTCIDARRERYCGTGALFTPSGDPFQVAPESGCSCFLNP